MVIAIDCRLYTDAESVSKHWGSLFIDHILATESTHQWILLLNQPNDTLQALQSNSILPVVCGKPATHVASRAWWYDYTLPAVFKKFSVELFLGIFGYVCLRTKLPQWLFLHDSIEPLFHEPKAGWNTIWYRHRLNSMKRKSTQVFDDYKARTPAAFAQINPDIRKKLVHFGRFPVPLPQVYLEEHLQLTKNKVTDGKEFFLCIEGWQQQKVGLQLLLSFAAFKKRMQSGMKLVLLGIPKDKENWDEKMKTYRYRSDVIQLSTMPNELFTSDLLAAAYGLVHLPVLPDTNYLLYAMGVGTPAIVNQHEVWQELAADSVLYYQEADPKAQIATWFMMLYKDEKHRRELLEAALQLASKNTGSSLAQKLLTHIAAKV